MAMSDVEFPTAQSLYRFGVAMVEEDGGLGVERRNRTHVLSA
jgi:hypothetical protein